MIVEFDGGNFHGWQSQKGVRNVQDTIKDAIMKMTGEEVKLWASSRIDAGVHALSLPICFFTNSSIPPRGFLLGLNSILPEDVKIKEVQEVSQDFYVRRNAIFKTYVYKIWNCVTPSPIIRRFSWHFPPPLNIEDMKKGAIYLIGEHDFSSFRSSQCDSCSPYRYIHNIDIFWEGKYLLNIEISANAFLRNMARIITGTLVYVGIGKIKPCEVNEILMARDRRKAGITAPPYGLFLKEVKYNLQ